jgi:hypothetical protein
VYVSVVDEPAFVSGVRIAAAGKGGHAPINSDTIFGTHSLSPMTHYAHIPAMGLRRLISFEIPPSAIT